MEVLFDPGCVAGRQLALAHSKMRAMLGSDATSKLGAKVDERVTAERDLHRAYCPYCAYYQPRCELCGNDARAPHAWRCPNKPDRAADLLPWRWPIFQRPARAGPAAAERPPPAAVKRERVAPVARERVRPRAADQAAARTAPPHRPAASKPASAPSVKAKPAPPRTAARPPPPSKPLYTPPKKKAAPPKPPAKPNPQDPYFVLGLTVDADLAAVRAKYRAMAQLYHPDKVAHLAPEFQGVAAQRMAEINTAYDRLKKVLA